MKKLLLIIFFSSTVLAQDDLLSLSLDEAVEYGIENNRNLRNAEREIQMAFKERWKTIAIGLPNVSLELNYLNNLELQTSLIPAEFFGGNKGDFSEIQFGTEQSAIGSVRMEQLLFDGSWLVGLEYSQIYLSGSENFYEKTLLEVRESIIKLYGFGSTEPTRFVIPSCHSFSFKKRQSTLFRSNVFIPLPIVWTVASCPAFNNKMQVETNSSKLSF
mgnify:CR=1 FL=1